MATGGASPLEEGAQLSLTLNLGCSFSKGRGVAGPRFAVGVGVGGWEGWGGGVGMYVRRLVLVLVGPFTLSPTILRKDFYIYVCY